MGKITILTNIFQMDWNHQPVDFQQKKREQKNTLQLQRSRLLPLDGECDLKAGIDFFKIC